jgi:hypothetical protein
MNPDIMLANGEKGEVVRNPKKFGPDLTGRIVAREGLGEL